VLRQIWEKAQDIIVITGLDPVIHALLQTERRRVAQTDGPDKTGDDGLRLPGMYLVCQSCIQI
jgi:hypothetical protein